MRRALRRFALRHLLVAAAAFGAGIAHGGPAVVVEGLVERPGAQALGEGARLFDAVHAAGVKAEAFLAGAAWLSRDRLAEQQALKTGLLFDLAVVERGARLEGRDGLATLAARLAAQVRAMPVSGRRLNTLDPVRLELETRSNRPLADSDRLLFPPRPATVTVTGAVEADCTLPFTGLRAATAYAADCPPHAAADPEWLYLIQPDGAIMRRGIAPWNRDGAQPLAPGARIYLPLRAALLEGRAEELNDDFAAFLATQPLATEGAGR
jgi:hypothetical protein